MAPDVSVILPTYNRAAILPEAIESVLAQSYQDLELIVVDDASTDGTTDVLDQIEDPRLRVIVRDTNGGQCAARNTGAAAARAQLLAYIDSNAVWHPAKLEKQVQAYARAQAQATVVFCAGVHHIGDKTNRVPSSGRAIPEGDMFAALSRGNFIDTSTLLVPADLLEEVGGWDEDLDRLVDWDLVLRLSQEANFRYIDEALVQIRRRDDSVSNTTPLIPSYDRVLDKYPAARDHGARAFARELASKGDTLVHSGHVQKGSRYLKEAVELEPRARRIGKFVLSLAGARVYRGVHRSLRWFRGWVEQLGGGRSADEHG